VQGSAGLTLSLHNLYDAGRFHPSGCGGIRQPPIPVERMTSRSPRVGQRRPGGRTERVREMVATTVLDLIKNGNIDFSYNDVAEISGIHKTTLYRRWPQRIDLVKEALKQHNSLLKIPHGKTWSETAEALVKSVARFL